MSRAPLVLASELAGRPVVCIESGDDIAEIKDVVFDPVTHALVGFTLNKHGWLSGRLKATLPAASVTAIGPDAVMIASAADLTEGDGGPAGLDRSSDSITVIGSTVLSSAGDDLGRIGDVVIETSSSPEAAGYQVEGEGGQVFVPISAQLALSDDTLILPAEARDFVRNDLAGFAAAMEERRRPLDDASPGSADREHGEERPDGTGTGSADREHGEERPDGTGTGSADSEHGEERPDGTGTGSADSEHGEERR